ncbi:unnamed protein product, partial [Thlaspi arvense]
GRGHVNPKGLRFYKNLINELTSHGIEPHVTLYHNDLPQALEDEYGGWIDRKIINDFTAFTYVCFREFGNKVKFWSTINEPNMIARGSYDLGVMPPNHCSPPFALVSCSRGNSSIEPYIALHNMLLAHASTARLYKQKYKDKQNGSLEDKIATQRAKDFYLGWFVEHNHLRKLGLIFKFFSGWSDEKGNNISSVNFQGSESTDYPDVMKRIVGKRLPSFSEQESVLVKDSFDFLGLIRYTTRYIKQLSISGQRRLYFRHECFSEPYAFLSWDLYIFFQFTIHESNADSLCHFSGTVYGNFTLPEIDVLPWGLEGVLNYIKQNYGNPPVYILENGRPTNHHSSLHDVERVEYLHAYIAAVLNSVRCEWVRYKRLLPMVVYGFVRIFSITTTHELYHVNFSDPERKRSPKTSALWYSALLKGSIVSSQVNLSVSSYHGLVLLLSNFISFGRKLLSNIGIGKSM